MASSEAEFQYVRAGWLVSLVLHEALSSVCIQEGKKAGEEMSIGGPTDLTENKSFMELETQAVKCVQKGSVWVS